MQNANQKSKHDKDLNLVDDGKGFILHNFDTLDLTMNNFCKLSKSKALMYADYVSSITENYWREKL